MTARPVDAALERLKALHPKVIDLSLGRIEGLLARLGSPERRCPPVVHVAGTNGKGSSIAFLRAMLEAAGRRVHVYTSPHLVRFAERIRLAGRLIGEAELAGLLDECERANAGGPITFFEITTAAAFLAFARHPADVLLLETGLGGRLDATNVIARPRLVAITPVSVDHTQYLGGDLAAIAAEKAGILKPGIGAVVGRQGAPARAAILRRAEAVGAPIALFGREWSAEARGGGLALRDRDDARSYPAPGLFGPHQFENAGLAVACARRLADLAPDDAAIAAGLARPCWPGRLQRLERGRYVEILPAGWELWIDGGHNAAAGAVLARAVEGWAERPLHLVVGMLSSKQPEDFARPLAPWAASLTCVPVPGEPASFEAPALARRLAGAGSGPAPRVAPGVEAALAGLAESAASPARVLICGSLYLLGAVLAANEEAPLGA